MKNHCHRFVIASLIITVAIILTWSTIAATASGQSFKNRKSITVVDAHGVMVGPVFSTEDFFNGSKVTVAFEFEKQPFVLLVFPHQFLSNSGMGPLFESSNCSGSPLVASAGGSPLPANAISAPGSTVYLAQPDATPQQFNPFIGSELNPDGTCTPVSSALTAVPARATIDLDTLFTPPFSVR